MKNRRIELDVLRGVAILLVLGRHSISAPAEAGMLRPLAGLWNRFGWTGVDLFFVLSGFLIGGLLFGELKSARQIDVRRFLGRRGLKIWPMYYVFLALTALVGLLVQTGSTASSTWSDGLWAAVSNVQNYFGSKYRIQLWSLAIEEHFYLALPLWLSWKSRGSETPSIGRGLATLIVACTVFRTWHVFAVPFHYATHVFPTHLRFDSLLFGVLIAYVRSFRPALWAALGRHPRKLLLLGLTSIAPMFVLVPERSAFIPSLGLSCLYVGYGAILVAVLHWENRGVGGFVLHGPVGKSLALVGTYSYAIYLWHMDLGRPPALWLFKQLTAFDGALRWALGMGVYVVLAVVSGALLTWVIERPVLAFRERVFQAGSSNTAPDAIA